MKKIVILAITNNGINLARQINESLGEAYPIFVPEKRAQAGLQTFPKEDFKESMHYFFQNYTGLICIMATGIVVRGIAEVVADKRRDPAVVVLDEKGKNVISLLSGHVGGGNQLTNKIAEAIHGHAVITTATDVQGVTSIDLLAKGINGWYQDFKITTKRINGLLAEGQKVGLIQEDALVSDSRGLTLLQPGEDFFSYAAVLWVSSANVDIDKEEEKVIQIVPRKYVLGIGAKKGLTMEHIREEYLLFCKLHQIHPMTVAKVASIDLKKHEPGILNFVQWLEATFETYTQEQLASVAEKYPQSEFVREITGVGNVAQAAADLAGNGKILSKRYGNRGVTFALGEE